MNRARLQYIACNFARIARTGVGPFCREIYEARAELARRYAARAKR